MKIYRYENFQIVMNEGFFDAMGRGAGSLVRKAEDIITGKKSYKKMPNQDDLAKEILDHLNSLPSDYNRTGEYRDGAVHKQYNDRYTFIMKFKRDPEQKYKIDVSRHTDFRTKKIPEYTIVINKLKGSSFQKREMPTDREKSKEKPKEQPKEQGETQKKYPEEKPSIEREKETGKEKSPGPKQQQLNLPTGREQSNVLTTTRNSKRTGETGVSTHRHKDELKFAGFAPGKPAVKKDPEYDDYEMVSDDDKGEKSIKGGSEIKQLGSGREVGTSDYEKSAKKKYREILAAWKEKQRKSRKSTTPSQEARKKMWIKANESVMEHYGFSGHILNYEIFNEELFLKKYRNQAVPSVDHSKDEVLKCDQTISKKIFNKAEQLFRLTNKTVSGDARGGSNRT